MELTSLRWVQAVNFWTHSHWFEPHFIYTFSALMPLGNIHHFLIYTVLFSTSWLHTALYLTDVSLAIYDHFSRTQKESKTRAGHMISFLKGSELYGTRSHDIEKLISILTNQMTVSLYTDLLFVLYMNLCLHKAMFLYSTDFLNIHSRILLSRHTQDQTSARLSHTLHYQTLSIVDQESLYS
jgi:hypothetical protein